MLLNGELRVIERLGLLEPKLVVDGGACFGIWGDAVQERYPEVEVVSFDPQNGTCALGAYNGSLAFKVFPTAPERGTGALGYAEGVAGLHKWRTVPVMRLDSLFPPEAQIDFLKLDLEGMELEALKGLGALRPKAIQFEYGFANEAAGCPLSTFGEFFYPWGWTIRQLDWEANYGNWLAAPEPLLERFF